MRDEDMERADHEIVHRAAEIDLKWPNQLRTAADIAPEVLLSAERLLELANSGFAPHWRIDGGEPLFNLQELKKWGVRNVAYRCEGREIPVEIRVAMSPTIFPAHDAPPSIASVAGLMELPSTFPTGVYFLVHDVEVVYVGKSINPVARISTHTTSEAKVFNRAYLVPVPASRLDVVEQALIRVLRPRLNGPTFRDMAVNEDADFKVIHEFWPDTASALRVIRTAEDAARYAAWRAHEEAWKASQAAPEAP